MKLEMPSKPFDVVTSNEGGHSPETVAQMCVDKLISVSDTAHPALQAQAHAFRDQMLAVVLRHVSIAIEQDRATIAAQLRKAGYPEIAAQLKGL